MQVTPNYRLPYWQASDSVKRDDMNDAMSKIDTALGAKAEKSAVNALALTVADMPQIATGSYTGTGSGEGESSIFSIGFTPRAILVRNSVMSVTTDSLSALAVTGYNCVNANGDSVLRIVNNGFCATRRSDCSLNTSGKTYYYVAIG